MKKLLAILLVVITLFLTSCSKESKFGIEQFVDRMNRTFDTNLNTNSFLLSKRNENNILFSTDGTSMTALTINRDNNIKGLSILITAGGNIETTKTTFCQMCSILTGNDFTEQLKIFNDSEFFSEKIIFADGNEFITVGRFKYTIVSNTYSITFMCDRV